MESDMCDNTNTDLTYNYQGSISTTNEIYLQV